MATTQTVPKKKGLINFDFLQKLGKVLMTVIAVMPAAGLMISLGKLVQMGGGDIAAVMTIGNTMENIGWAVINNLHILFAVAIGGSWAKERAGGAFAAVLAFALINVITGNIFGVTSAMLADPNAVTHTLFGQEIAVNGYFTSVLGAPALNMGVFVGIISGFAGGVPCGIPLGGVMLSLVFTVSAFAFLAVCSGTSCIVPMTRADDNPIANIPFQFLIKITTFLNFGDSLKM